MQADIRSCPIVFRFAVRSLLLIVLVTGSFSRVHAEEAAESVSGEESVLAPVIVTSDLDKQNTPLVKAPGSLLKRDREQIREKTASDLSDVLSFEPNVDFTGGPRGATELPQIRGLGAERILILEDGVRQNFQSGHNGRVFSDFSLTEDIEVVKGPWSSLYGSGAMGGVISFRRSTAADYIRKSGQNHGVELGIDSGTAGSEYGGRLTAFGKAGFFEPLVSVRSSTSSNTRLGGDDTLEYSASRDQDVYGSFGFDLGEKHKLTMKVNDRGEVGETPLNPATETTVLSQLADMKTRKQDAVLDYRIEAGNSDFHVKPYFRKTKVEKIRLSDGRTDTQTVETVGIDTWNTMNWSLSDTIKSTTTVGVEYFQDTNTGTRGATTLSSFPNGKGSQYGVYLQPSFVLDEAWTITPGVRFDSYSNEDSSGASSNNSGEKTSLKLYSSYEFNPGYMIFAGWGQAFNAPRLQDLYVTGMHFPGNFFVPNPNLKPETAETVEVGTKNKVVFSEESFLQVNATGFFTEAKDFINRRVAATTTIMENVDQVQLYGLEAQAFYQTVTWGTGLSYGQVRSKNKTADAPLADTPADTWTAKFEWLGFSNWILGTDVKWLEKQTRVPTGVSESGEAFAQDIYASWARPTHEVRLRVNNVYDRAYIKHGSNIKEVGRDFRLQASYLF